MTYIASLRNGVKITVHAEDADVALFRLQRRGFDVKTVKPLGRVKRLP